MKHLSPMQASLLVWGKLEMDRQFAAAPPPDLCLACATA